MMRTAFLFLLPAILSLAVSISSCSRKPPTSAKKAFEQEATVQEPSTSFSQGPREETLQEPIEDPSQGKESASPPPPPAPIVTDTLIKSIVADEALIEPLTRFYQAKAGQKVWTHPVHAEALKECIALSHEHGLNPGDYSTPAVPEGEEGAESTGGKESAGGGELGGLGGLAEGLSDVMLSATAMRLFSDMSRGRVAPQQFGQAWTIEPKEVDPAALLESALTLTSKESFISYFKSFVPSVSFPNYSALKKELARYRQIESEGGYPTVPSFGRKPVGLGEHNDAVPALREFLIATNFLTPQPPPAEAPRLQKEQEQEAVPAPQKKEQGKEEAEGSSGQAEEEPLPPQGPDLTLFDKDVDLALKNFQREHGLDPDGILGPNTLKVINTPVTGRIDKLIANMERCRWLPQEYGSRHILINIPEFWLRGFAHGEKAVEMRVIVGRNTPPPGEKKPTYTPIFAREMKHIIFRPFWNVPKSIAKNEVVPQGLKNRNYFRMLESQYEIVKSFTTTAEVLEVSRSNLERVAEGELKIRQKAGHSNALGHIKFIFPNEHNVYLHDTNARHLFRNVFRAFSHGCIRVHKPAELAFYVLEDPEKWSIGRIESSMYSGERKYVPLSSSLYVYVQYWTARSREDGEGIVYFRDLYRHDKRLLEAIAGRSPLFKSDPEF